MDGFFLTKTKRKDLDDVYDEFSEFSLNSPARKIRRLDAELPPIMEEDTSIPVSFEEQMSEPHLTMIDSELPLNEERALVLYKPVASGFESIRVDPKLIEGLKNRAFWHSTPRPVRIEEIPLDEAFSNSSAVIPWVAQTGPNTMFVEEPMEAEEGTYENESMEIEEDSNQVNINNTRDVGENMHSWQQHCFAPGLPQNASTPVTPVTWSLR